jgi:Collagen triple helix repeat (20 copies)
MRKTTMAAVVALLVGGCTSSGREGAVGPTGPTGPQGVEGPSGPQGPAGAQGLTGPAGTSGPQGLTGLTGLTGPQGPAGLAGSPGLAGPTGPQGPAGAIGQTGPQGPSNAYAPWVDGAYAQHIVDLPANVTTTLASVTLPQGSYLVNAKVGLYNFSSSALGAQCYLKQTGDVLDGVTSGQLVSAGMETLVLQAATVVPASGAVLTLDCWCYLPNMRTYFPHLAALQVGTLTAP